MQITKNNDKKKQEDVKDNNQIVDKKEDKIER